MSVQRVQQDPQLFASCHDEGQVTVLELHGACDLATLGQLKAALTGARSDQGEGRLVVDASGVDFCDVSCARALWQATRHGEVEVTGMSDRTRRVLRLLESDAPVVRHVPAPRSGRPAADPPVVALTPRPTTQTPMEPVPRVPRSA